jgi:hypothetical protein
MGRHYTVTLDTVADSFLGLQLTHNTDGSVLLTQPKLLLKLFNEFPPLKNPTHQQHRHPYPPNRTGPQPDPAPCDGYKYLRLLGILMYATKSRPEILAAVSFASSKSSSPTDRDFQDLYYTVEYLRQSPTKGQLLQGTSNLPLQFHCEVDASYLIHLDSKSQTGYSIGFVGTPGTFYNRSQKQTLVSTSSMHSEMRAIYTLVKDLIFLFLLCKELRIQIALPALVMEDNSAVITVTTIETAYTKKCKHFIMLINYIKEQVTLGLIKILKIDGQLNRADLHTKILRDSSFMTKAHGILGLQPPNTTPTTSIDTQLHAVLLHFSHILHDPTSVHPECRYHWTPETYLPHESEAQPRRGPSACPELGPRYRSTSPRPQHSLNTTATSSPAHPTSPGANSSQPRKASHRTPETRSPHESEVQPRRGPPVHPDLGPEYPPLPSGPTSTLPGW